MCGRDVRRCQHDDVYTMPFEHVLGCWRKDMHDLPEWVYRQRGAYSYCPDAAAIELTDAMQGSSQCTFVKCTPGQFPVGRKCSSCVAGTASKDGMTCMDCPVNTYSGAGAGQCTACSKDHGTKGPVRDKQHAEEECCTDDPMSIALRSRLMPSYVPPRIVRVSRQMPQLPSRLVLRSYGCASMHALPCRSNQQVWFCFLHRLSCGLRSGLDAR